MILYRLLYSLLKNLVVLLQPVLGSSMKKWVALRNQNLQKTQVFKNTYWFHAASGEIEYCKSVIRLLKEQNPKAQVVVTYTSPSAEKLFSNIKNLVDQFITLPWDQAQACNELIDYIQPQVLIFSRTDLWPELIVQVHKRSIALGLISYNPRFGFVSKKLQSFLLPKFDFISCVDETIKSQLPSDCKNLSADGDTRFDQVFYRLSQESKLGISPQRTILVCGSTWPEDEEVLIASFADLFNFGVQIVLSPHEVSKENIQRLIQNLQKHNYSYQLLSEQPNANAIQFTTGILIIDKIGYLADAYRYAHIAFIGGSFKEKIHSVMEALCCGVPVITGPHFKNNPEAVKYIQKFVFAVKDSQSFRDQFLALLENPPQDILSEMKKNKNSSAKVLQLILNTHPKN